MNSCHSEAIRQYRKSYAIIVVRVVSLLKIMNLTGRVTRVYGRNVGISKLGVTVTIRNEGRSTLSVLAASAEFHASFDNYAGINDQALFLGSATIEASPNVMAGGGETQWIVSVPITNSLILQRLEELRRGRDLLLLVKMQISIAAIDQADPTKIGFALLLVSSADHSTGHCVLRVAKSDWLPVLKQLGYGDYYLCEIPMRAVPKFHPIQRSLNHLEGAWAHFNQGSDAEALTGCFRCLETLAKDHGAEKPDQNGWDKVLQGIDNQKREKLKYLLNQLSSFMHLGRHEQSESAAVSLDRADAEYAMILTQATMAYIAKLWSTRADTPAIAPQRKHRTRTAPV